MYVGNLTKGTPESAGYDIHAAEAKVLPVGVREWISTGVYLNLAPGTAGEVRSRSGLAKKGIDVGAGLIDSDYTGEVKVLLINNSKDPFYIGLGDRIAQLVIFKFLEITPTEVLTKQGDHKGFGSTGI